MALFILRADAGNLQANGLDIVMNISNGTGLLGASGRKIGRIEIQDQGAIFQEIA